MVSSFLENLVLARSAARKNSMAADQLPAYVRFIVHTGQPFAADFTKPVRGEDIVRGSIDRLKASLLAGETFLGSRMGIEVVAEYEEGVKSDSLDQMINKVALCVV